MTELTNGTSPHASPSLTADEIDDILYFARANEVTDLRETIEALSKSYNRMSESILRAAIDPDSKNSALHYAGANGHSDLLTSLITLLKSSASSTDSSASFSSLLNLQNGAGNTPLHYAALNGQLAAVKVLLLHGADVSILNEAGHDAVFEAERADHEAVVEFLLKEGDGLEAAVGGGAEDEGEALDQAEAGEEAEASNSRQDGELAQEVEQLSVKSKGTEEAVG